MHLLRKQKIGVFHLTHRSCPIPFSFNLCSVVRPHCGASADDQGLRRDCAQEFQCTTLAIAYLRVVWFVIICNMLARCTIYIEGIVEMRERQLYA